MSKKMQIFLKIMQVLICQNHVEKKIMKILQPYQKREKISNLKQKIVNREMRTQASTTLHFY
jgi:predicted ABC-type exoprotein transport system permease subunit